jgi:hypothetical protein
MEVKVLSLHTTKNSFDIAFKNYKQDFLKVLSNSYKIYYGDDYQLRRIIEEKSVLFFAIVNNTVVGASYVKANLRRGGTAVFPEQYRRMGIAEALVKESLKIHPRQYTILKVDNFKMIALMEKLNFKKASSDQEIKAIVKDEFSQFSDFKFSEEYLVFNRYSVKREAHREALTLLHTF